MIETKQLTKTFANKVAVRELDLIVRPGEILGFLGPNGAGKSTTVKMLVGMLRPNGGVARVAGLDVAEHPTEIKKRHSTKGSNSGPPRNDMSCSCRPCCS